MSNPVCQWLMLFLQNGSCLFIHSNCLFILWFHCYWLRLPFCGIQICSPCTREMMHLHFGCGAENKHWCQPTLLTVFFRRTIIVTQPRLHSCQNSFSIYVCCPLWVMHVPFQTKLLGPVLQVLYVKVKHQFRYNSLKTVA